MKLIVLLILLASLSGYPLRYLVMFQNYYQVEYHLCTKVDYLPGYAIILYYTNSGPDIGFTNKYRYNRYADNWAVYDIDSEIASNFMKCHTNCDCLTRHLPRRK